MVVCSFNPSIEEAEAGSHSETASKKRRGKREAEMTRYRIPNVPYGCSALPQKTGSLSLLIIN